MRRLQPRHQRAHARVAGLHAAGLRPRAHHRSGRDAGDAYADGDRGACGDVRPRCAADIDNHPHRLLAERAARPRLPRLRRARAPERGGLGRRVPARHFPDPELHCDAGVDGVLRRAVGADFCRPDLDSPSHAGGGCGRLGRGAVPVERRQRIRHAQGERDGKPKADRGDAAGRCDETPKSCRRCTCCPP